MMRRIPRTARAAELPPGAVRLGTPAGRRVLLATVLGSGMAFLDGTVVNIALPHIGRDLGAGVEALQWTVNAYTLTLAGLLLLGGALGDRAGRRRVFVAGVLWFTVASVACAAAPTAEVLIAARALQGVGAALLTPGSLAILEAVFHPDDRGAAIGAWSGLGGAAAALGPFAGGWLIDAVSWRAIFLINVPLAIVVVWTSVRHVPETRDASAEGGLDLAGAALAASGLAGVVLGLTRATGSGWTDRLVLGSLAAGTLALAAFLVTQARVRNPMLPLGLFRDRRFSAANAVTLLVYAALGGGLFLLPVQLQVVLGYSALGTGMALLPLTAVMLVLSARVGRIAQRIGPRLPMTAGSALAAAGMWLMVRIDGDARYAADVLPAVLVLALGLSLVVAPLTATVMSAAGPRAGVASAINNDVARIASLLAVAVLPIAAGLGGGDLADPAALGEGFRTGVLICALLCAGGAVVSALAISGGPRPAAVARTHCPVDGPPLAGRRPPPAEIPPGAATLGGRAHT